MNIFKLRGRLPGMILALSSLLLSGCATKTDFLTSSSSPAARGYVKVKQDDNQNYGIQVHVDYLAEVERLQPARRTYVVWLETANDMVKNLGQLQSDTKSISNNLKADFETVSSVEPRRVFITAEMDGNTTYPDQTIILDSGKLKS